MRKKGKFKKLLSLVVSLCMVIGYMPVLSLTAMAAPSNTGLFAGKYGKAQIFDCQRTPPFPVAGVTFTASGFQNIYNDVDGGSFAASVWGTNSDRYVQFYDRESGDGNVGLNLYEANGDFVQIVSPNGKVWGLGEAGFLYVSTSRDYGYFVSNKEGFAYGNNLTYTPTTGQVTDTSILSAYEATATVLVAGQTAEDLESTYTVTFDSQGGSDITSTTDVAFQATITEPNPDPDYEGHIFQGWYQNPECTQAWDFDNDKVISNITLYAKWESAYTVTFDSKGGSAVTSATGVTFAPILIEKPTPDPDYEGHVFKGWYQNTECTQAWDFDNDKVTTSITLYAKWILESEVPILIYDSGSIEVSNTTRNIAVSPNGKIFVAYQTADGIYVKYSTDNGKTFSNSVQVSDTMYEAEIAASSNGYVYVSWVDASKAIHISRADSSAASLSFTETVSPGVSSTSMVAGSKVHMATDGDYIYIVDASGQSFYYSTNSGETYSSDATADVEGGDGAYVFSDVHVNTYTHQIVVQKDKPSLTYYISDDYAQTFKVYSDYFEAPDTASNYVVSYSVGSLASGSDESYLYIAGYSPTMKINLIDGKFTSGLSTNSTEVMQGRSLSADSYGNVVAGYTDAASNGNVCFQVSNDYGVTFGNGVTVDAGYISNAAINSTNGDVMFLYQDASGYNNVYFVVYSGLLSGYALELDTSSVYFSGEDDSYTVEVTNTTDGDITIGDIKLSTGNNFEIESITDEDGNELSDDAVVSAGKTIYINVDFIPTEIGTLSDTLTIDYSYETEGGNEITGTRVVTLSGTASTVTAPNAPETFTASAGNESITLNWSDTEKATSYNVYSVSVNGAGETVYTLVASDITDTSYTVENLTNATTYSYAVKAVSSVGSSDYSGIATATPEAGTTYSLALNAGAGTINSGSIISYVSGKATVLPTDVTMNGATFGGWYANSTFSGSRVYSIGANETGNKTYYALWLYAFSGTISSDSENMESYNVDAVYLMQNDTKIDASEFDNNSYFFNEVSKGYYNLVMDITVTIGITTTEMTITKLIYVDGSTNGNIVLPKGLFTSKITVAGDSTPEVEAGGLDELATAIGGNGSDTVEIELKVETNEDSDNADAVNDEITANGKITGLMLDIDLMQTITPTSGSGTTTNITNLSDINDSPDTVAIIIHLPNELQGKNGYAVYRYHNGEVQVLTRTPNENGEYIVVNAARTQITAYLNKFSTYAVATAGTNTVTLDANGGTLTTDEVSTSYNSKVGTLPIPTRSGYTFAGWYTSVSGGTLVTSDTTETEASDYTLHAQWTKKSSSSDTSSPDVSATTKSYSITITSSEHGSISPSGTASVTNGSNKTFTITPDEGYVIADVLVDGVSVGAVSSYTLSDVSETHTIKAVFEAEAEAVSGLPYYYDEHDNKIFIGFAADKDDEMTYIAPDEETVLFQENPKSFTDISGHWAKASINFVTERELFMGTSTNTFSPNAGMTRAMFATVIGRLYERSYGEITDLGTHGFADCDYNEYYGAYVDWCAKNDIIVGIGGGLFEPSREISRQEMASILYRFASFLEVLPDDIDTTLDYSDTDTISDWANSSALYCQSTDIISGRDGGAFVPKGTATRAEVAAVIERFVESVIN